MKAHEMLRLMLGGLTKPRFLRKTDINIFQQIDKIFVLIVRNKNTLGAALRGLASKEGKDGDELNWGEANPPGFNSTPEPNHGPG